MIALLVEAIYGNVRPVSPPRGDWEAGALVGEFNGRVMIWQPENSVDKVRSAQLMRIRSSFEAARHAAANNGYLVERWVLCVRASMEGAARRAWQSWRAERQSSTGIVIDLWDENKLRALLLRPEAAPVARSFYRPYRDPERPHREPG